MERSNVPPDGQLPLLLDPSKSGRGTLERSNRPRAQKKSRIRPFEPTRDVDIGCDACGRIHPHPEWMKATRSRDASLRCPACGVVGRGTTQIWLDDEDLVDDVVDGEVDP